MPTVSENWSQVIAKDEWGYYNPTTNEAYTWEAGEIVVDLEQVAGRWVVGVDMIQTFGTTTDADAPISDEDNRYNLEWASSEALRKTGLSGVAKADLVGQDYVAYMQALRETILANAEFFNATTVQVAQNLNLNRLDDQGYAREDAEKPIDPTRIVVSITDVVSNAANSVTSTGIGKAASDLAQVAGNALGALTKAAALLEWAVPLAMVGVLWFAIRSVGTDPGGQFKKAAGGFAEFLPYR